MFLATEISFGYGDLSQREKLDLLSKLFEVYGETFDDVFVMLRTWLMDFALENQFPCDFLCFEEVVPFENEFMFLFLVDKANAMARGNLGFNMIGPLLNKELSETALAKAGKEGVFAAVMMIVINQLDLQLESADLPPIYQAFGESELEVMEYYTFMDTPWIESHKVSAEFHNYLKDEILCERMSEIMRFVENLMRKHYGIRGRLRNIDLEENMQEFITQVVENNLQELDNYERSLHEVTKTEVTNRNQTEEKGKILYPDFTS